VSDRRARLASVAAPWAQLVRCPKSGPASLSTQPLFEVRGEATDQEEEAYLQEECFGLLLDFGLLAQIRPLIALKNLKGGRSPLRPPMRPLRLLETGTPHTIRHLKSCPIIAVVGGSVRKAGRAGATAIDLGHIIKKEQP
jgi:hypothetical protein